MQSFTDTLNKAWSLTVDLPTRSRVRKETAGLPDGPFDLFAVLDRDLSGLARLGEPDVLITVLYAMLEPELVKLAIGPEQFAGRFDGDTIEAAQKAVAEACADFFPSRRNLMRGILAKGEATTALALRLATEKVDTISPQDLLDRMLKNSSTKPPASSASTPTDPALPSDASGG